MIFQCHFALSLLAEDDRFSVNTISPRCSLALVSVSFCQSHTRTPKVDYGFLRGNFITNLRRGGSWLFETSVCGGGGRQQFNGKEKELSGVRVFILSSIRLNLRVICSAEKTSPLSMPKSVFCLLHKAGAGLLPLNTRVLTTHRKLI